jgi:tetratricopeptide (TPR) repeat protein
MSNNVIDLCELLADGKPCNPLTLKSQEKIIDDLTYGDIDGSNVTTTLAMLGVELDSQKHMANEHSRILIPILIQFLLAVGGRIIGKPPIAGSPYTASIEPYIVNILVYVESKVALLLKIGSLLYSFGEAAVSLEFTIAARKLLWNDPKNDEPTAAVAHKYPIIVNVTIAIGNAYYDKGNFNKGLFFAKQCIGLLRHLELDNLFKRQSEVSALILLGMCFVAKKNYEHGGQYLLRAQTKAESLAIGIPCVRLALCCAIYTQARSSFLENFAKYMPMIVTQLEQVNTLMGPLLKEAIGGPSYGHYMHCHASVMCLLGQVYGIQGKLPGSLKLLLQALQIKRSLLPEHHPDVCIVMLEIGLHDERMSCAIHDPAEKLKYTRRAFTRVEHAHAALITALGPNHPSTISSGSHLDRIRLMPR